MRGGGVDVFVVYQLGHGLTPPTCNFRLGSLQQSELLPLQRPGYVIIHFTSVMIAKQTKLIRQPDDKQQGCRHEPHDCIPTNVQPEW
mmetsp:Transcript_82489/g.146162  ORF Transcript_82489/g.146162 Transcript_82489/m.146162 type:complete len:87 (+) Transcript_82489:1-261(+)